MKKLISLIALIAAMFTANATVANAQMNYDAVNYRIAEVHTKEYINKGDDAYRMGNYKEAMECYKNAREYNTRRGREIVPQRDIDRKMDRCASAMRTGIHHEHHEPVRRHREEKASTAAAAIGGAILGGILVAALSSNSSRNAEATTASSSSSSSSSLRDVTCNGISYETLESNPCCRVLSVTSDYRGTMVEMEYLNLASNDRIKIDKNTFIKDRSTGMKLTLQDAENIASRDYMSVPRGETHVFRLYFQRLSSSCTEVDIIEPGSSSWKFYHVPVNE